MRCTASPERAVEDAVLVHSISRKRHAFPPLPHTSQERLAASLNDRPFENLVISESELSAAKEKNKTVLYLAYGSNLCAETFREKRGIRPLSQVNVLVPELRLTFDLPGFPYAEPCFANTAHRDPTQPETGTSDYHKDRWHKGMVGCVYEVSMADYAHIIATEGGGASYKDIVVTCYVLPEADTVPDSPSTQAFKAHTLYAPARGPAEGGHARPDRSYAQPSARYLKLITDGADELALPREYKEYLHGIRPYTITTKMQEVGKILFTATWMPIVLLIMSLQKSLQDKRGRSPKWLSAITAVMFTIIWTTYDVFWKPVFGDGERTIYGDDGESMTNTTWPPAPQT
ncbi:hypothetical protein M011DRAFT_493063 [Sporormia fimetaria CBS 119925]|uniref:gamma-glutamylcyclotransferase n=1 Tax=Sporormia fimetaria CBS 119925 TaxID=1340428 RepID=A0A6A6VFE9_9PLEO|nr:hypothetical protein M011DRAFT_493063 [Sporormia fimetaria CBS 119925]